MQIEVRDVYAHPIKKRAELRSVIVYDRIRLSRGRSRIRSERDTREVAPDICTRDTE
jgi:hypothetical protein